MYVSAFFTNLGVPETGLSPTITIWNAATRAAIVTGAAMTEVASGWYTYNFASHVKTIEYAFTCDGGAGLPITERYAPGVIDLVPELTAGAIADAVWDEAAAGHVAVGSVGELQGNLVDLNMAISDLPTAQENAAAVWDEPEADHVTSGSMGKSLSIIRQVEVGKWAIVGNTMTLYADNGTDVIASFTLTDKHGHAIALDDGAPAEREPI